LFVDRLFCLFVCVGCVRVVAILVNGVGAGQKLLGFASPLSLRKFYSEFLDAPSQIFV
jgi:hypothetical protein